jgi:hypothetical protein
MTKTYYPQKEQEYVVYVRYLDHVFFSRCEPLLIKPQVREALGWLVYDCEKYVTLCWDRDAGPPTIKGGDPKASGLVLLKSDMLEFKKLEISSLPLQENQYCHLNSPEPISNSECALQPTERKTRNKQKGEMAT